MTGRSPLHALTWLAWALAAAACAQLAPSPVYVALVVLVAVAVVEVHGSRTPLAAAFPVLVAVAAGFGVLRVVLTALTTHGGGDVIATLPSVDLPAVLGGFELGGTIELPVVLQTASESFVLVAIVAAFAALNAVASHHELLQAAPKAFHEPGLIVTVALAFVPSTMAAIRGVREADRARTGGRAVRRGRVLRQLVPVLETGLERALALAESMDARGFAALPPSRAERAAGWSGLAGLLALAGAFLALVGRQSAVAAVAGSVGAALVALAVVLLGRADSRTRHRRRRMTNVDRAVALACVAAPVLVGVAAISGDASLVWRPHPVELPAFHLTVAAALLPLAAPLAVPRRRAGTDRGGAPGAGEATIALAGSAR